MANQVNLSINDAQGSPVAHTFVASGVDAKGVALYLEKTTSSLVTGFFRLTQSTRLATKMSEPNRHAMKLVIPTIVVETLNGVNYSKVARQSMISIDCIIAADSTAQERKDLCVFAANNLANYVGSNYFGYTVVNQEGVI